MKTLIFTLCGMALIFGIPLSVYSTNLGFEEGNLSYWTLYGDTSDLSVVSSYIDVITGLHYYAGGGDYFFAAEMPGGTDRSSAIQSEPFKMLAGEEISGLIAFGWDDSANDTAMAIELFIADLSSGWNYGIELDDYGNVLPPYLYYTPTPGWVQWRYKASQEVAGHQLSLILSFSNEGFPRDTYILLDVVPEPSTILLLASGLLGLWGARRKLKK